jgi:hypothetical protein
MISNDEKYSSMVAHIREAVRDNAGSISSIDYLDEVHRGLLWLSRPSGGPRAAF